MTKILILFLFLFQQQPETTTAKVVYVSDGDTFHALPGSGGEKIKIRLEGIDTPERAQPFGLEAKEFVIKAKHNKEVVLKITDVNRYGRKIAIVYFDGGKDLRKELLKAGLAWHYKRYNDDQQLAKL